MSLASAASWDREFLHLSVANYVWTVFLVVVTFHPRRMVEYVKMYLKIWKSRTGSQSIQKAQAKD